MRTAPNPKRHCLEGGTNNITVPISDLGAGIYFVSVTTADETVTKKVVVER